jgi:hypothetical protein
MSEKYRWKKMNTFGPEQMSYTYETFRVAYYEVFFKKLMQPNTQILWL